MRQSLRAAGFRNLALDWKLSNIKFQFKYKNTLEFGNDISQNIPNDIVFMFDDNDPPRGDGHYQRTSGSPVIEHDYYPLVMNDRMIDHAKILSIESDQMLTFRVDNIKSILFKPKVHTDKVVKIVGPEKNGDETLTIYPDGSRTIKLKGSYPLDFKRLRAIK